MKISFSYTRPLSHIFIFLHFCTRPKLEVRKNYRKKKKSHEKSNVYIDSKIRAFFRCAIFITFLTRFQYWKETFFLFCLAFLRTLFFSLEILWLLCAPFLFFSWVFCYPLSSSSRVGQRILKGFSANCIKPYFILAFSKLIKSQSLRRT